MRSHKYLSNPERDSIIRLKHLLHVYNTRAHTNKLKQIHKSAGNDKEPTLRGRAFKERSDFPVDVEGGSARKIRVKRRKLKQNLNINSPRDLRVGRAAYFTREESGLR